jgi:hypothetical protein
MFTTSTGTTRSRVSATARAEPAVSQPVCLTSSVPGSRMAPRPSRAPSMSPSWTDRRSTAFFVRIRRLPSSMPRAAGILPTRAAGPVLVALLPLVLAAEQFFTEGYRVVFHAFRSLYIIQETTSLPPRPQSCRCQSRLGTTALIYLTTTSKQNKPGSNRVVGCCATTLSARGRHWSPSI